jgi:hypothetical protein
MPGTPTQPAYRAFLVDTSGHIFFAHTLDSQTDQEAIKIARQYVSDHNVQVWDGSRKIADLPREKPLDRASKSIP